MNRCDKNAWFQLCSWAADRYSTALSQQPSAAWAAIAALFIFHCTWHKADTEGRTWWDFLGAEIYIPVSKTSGVNYRSFKPNEEFDTFRYACTRWPNCLKKIIPFCTHFSLNMLSALLNGDPHHHFYTQADFLTRNIPGPASCHGRFAGTWCRSTTFLCSPWFQAVSRQPHTSLSWVKSICSDVCFLLCKYLVLMHRETTFCIRPVSSTSIDT